MIRKPALLLILLFIGISFGWLGFLLYGDISGNCKILYLSKAEILELERSRVEKMQDNRLFLGKIDDAIRLIYEEAMNMENKKSKVIIVDNKLLHPLNARSISSKVHEIVIDKLKEINSRQRAAGSMSEQELKD